MGITNIGTAAVTAIIAMAITAVNAAADSAAASDRPFLCTMSSASWWAYLVIAAVGIAAGVGCTLLVRHLLRVVGRKTSPSPTQEATGTDTAELVAQTDGREFALGPVGEIHRFTIGSGPSAAVALTGNGILARHVALRRDGGMFCLHNRSRGPLRVNGVTVSGGGRCRLVMPTEIRINDNTAVSLLVRPKGRAPHRDLPPRLRTGLSRLFKLAFITFIVIGAATAATTATANHTSLVQPLRLWVTFDTSPSTKGADDEMRAVAEAAIKALLPGDGVSIISAHADRPRLRAIVTIRPEEGDLTPVLEGIKPARLLDADLAAALDVVVASLRGNRAEVLQVDSPFDRSEETQHTLMRRTEHVAT